MVVFRDRLKTSIGSVANSGPGYTGGLYEVDRLLVDQATSGAPTVVTAFDEQPTVPAIIVFTPGGVTADNKAGDIIVVGTDFEGTAQTENVTITDNIATPVQTVNPYATVTSITFPLMDGAGATWDVGQAADMLTIFRVPIDQPGTLIYEVHVHFPTAPTTAEAFLIALDAAAGVNYDAELYTADADAGGAVSSFRWAPTVPVFLKSGEALVMTFANTDANLFGIEVITGTT